MKPTPLHVPTSGGPWEINRAVLVLRALGLGDAVVSIAALRGIRRAFPQRWILLASSTGTGQWLQRLGLVDAVLPTDGLSPLNWPPPLTVGAIGHLAVNLHGRGPESHRVLADTAPDRLIAFRQPRAGHAAGPRWRPAEHEVDRWCRLVRTAGGPCSRNDLRLAASGPRTSDVLLHPGAASGSRRWPVPRWSWLAGKLVRQGFSVVLTGGPGEKEICDRIIVGIPASTRSSSGMGAVRSTAGTLDLPGLADLIGRAAVLVSGDTGVAHLATAYGTPSVLLFGPTPPRRWGPAIDPDRHTVLWHGQDDAPGDPHADTIDAALAAITRDEVLDAVLQALHPVGAN
jgi:ADP-heptose:LPS heptosyltransferase